MKEGAGMLMLGQIVNELLVSFGQLRGRLVKGHARGVHDGQIVPEGLEEFHEADAVGHIEDRHLSN